MTVRYLYLWLVNISHTAEAWTIRSDALVTRQACGLLWGGGEPFFLLTSGGGGVFFYVMQGGGEEFFYQALK